MSRFIKQILNFDQPKLSPLQLEALRVLKTHQEHIIYKIGNEKHTERSELTIKDINHEEKPYEVARALSIMIDYLGRPRQFEVGVYSNNPMDHARSISDLRSMVVLCDIGNERTSAVEDALNFMANHGVNFPGASNFISKQRTD